MANRYWVGGSGTWNASNTTNWSATSGGTGGASVPTSADTVFLDAASGTVTVTLGANVTVSRLLLNSVFTGTIAFNGFKISLAGNAATIFNGSALTTYTGSPIIECTYSGSTGTRTLTTNVTNETTSFSFNIIAGTDIVQSAQRVKDLNFTGFSGTFEVGTTNKFIYGSLTLSSTMSLTTNTGPFRFEATSGTATHTFNNKTFNCPVTFNAAGSTQILNDALIVGSANTLTLTAGTVNFKSGTTSSAGTFIINGNPTIVLNATTSGSPATISQSTGTVNAQNATIKDITATGGATWNATNNVVDGGGNTGWNFTPSPVYAMGYAFALRSFTERKHF